MRIGIAILPHEAIHRAANARGAAVEDVREPGKDALADDAERRTGRFGMLGDVAEATFDLVEESAAEPGTPEVVEVRRFVQAQVRQIRGYRVAGSRPARPRSGEDILSGR